MHGPYRLEERASSHASDSTLAELAPTGHAGWSWPRALFWKLSISLPKLPLLSGPPCLFSCFLTSAREELPVAGTGGTSSSLRSRAARQLLQRVWQSPTHTGPPTRLRPLGPSHQPSPTALMGQRVWPQAQLQGLLLPGGGVHTELNPGTPGEGRPAGSGCPGQPILTDQGLVDAENGPCRTGQVQGTCVAS